MFMKESITTYRIVKMFLIKHRIIASFSTVIMAQWRPQGSGHKNKYI